MVAVKEFLYSAFRAVDISLSSEGRRESGSSILHQDRRDNTHGTDELNHEKRFLHSSSTIPHRVILVNPWYHGSMLPSDQKNGGIAFVGMIIVVIFIVFLGANVKDLLPPRNKNPAQSDMTRPKKRQVVNTLSHRSRLPGFRKAILPFTSVRQIRA